MIQNRQTLGRESLRASAEPAQRRFARYAGLVLLATMGALVIAVLSFSQVALTPACGRIGARQCPAASGNGGTPARPRRRCAKAHKMEAVGQLSGGIAHDFNNLIMIVKGNLRLLRKRVDTTGEWGGEPTSLRRKKRSTARRI